MVAQVVLLPSKRTPTGAYNVSLAAKHVRVYRECSTCFYSVQPYWFGKWQLHDTVLVY